ncbi:MAG: queuosine salvage family protein [Chloroflexota bacterium]|nr:queuosine salvage family protein [Chloroflexota bacterium]
MDAPDLLGVLSSTRPVMEEAKHVRIDAAKVEAVAEEMAASLREPPAWDASLHFRDGTWRTAGWVLALDALNFCFWGDTPDPAAHWKVAFRGEIHDGYWALAAALTRAVEEGCPLWDHRYLAELTAAELREILCPAPGAPEIPLFEARLANLRELGHGLLAWEGSATGETPLASLIQSAERSAVRLVRSVVEAFPSFDDVAVYGGREVRLYKRAQILVADLAGAFDGGGLGAFDDLDALTAFADYKVPQVLRRLGLLVYDHDLATRVDRYELLAAGSSEEVEIRAATIWACEALRRALVVRGHSLHAFEVDWALWSAGQHLPPDARPYHRTRTIFY